MKPIVIHIPAHFIEERSYALNALFGELLELPITIHVTPGETGYRVVLDQAGEIVIEDHFFNRCSESRGYLHRDMLPSSAHVQQSPYASHRSVVRIFGTERIQRTGNRVTLGADIVAATFFMLTRWEEYVLDVQDRGGRFPSHASLAGRSGFLSRPIVNEYADLLLTIIEHLGFRPPARRRRYKLSLTHDIDHLFRWMGLTSALSLSGDLLHRRSPSLFASGVHNYFSHLLNHSQDYYDTYDTLMDIADEVNCKCTFNIMAHPISPFVSRRAWLRGMKELLRRIHIRGHQLGFHPGTGTHTDSRRWSSEHHFISAMSPQHLLSGRQHSLLFSVPHTWQIWNDHGMLYDSTVGYADHEGFRCGVCTPFNPFNVLTRKCLHVIEQPLIAMDVSLVDYRRLTPEQSFTAVTSLIDEVKRHAGNFVMVWHNNNINGPRWSDYASTYRRLVRYAAP